MNWLKWVFCPHDWSIVIYKNEVINESGGVVGYEWVYQCSKCTRFKKVSL